MCWGHCPNSLTAKSGFTTLKEECANEVSMLFGGIAGKQEVFRRDWGPSSESPVRSIGPALDAITPSNDDCSMRIIVRESMGYLVSIAFYANIYFASPITKLHHVTLTDEVMRELIRTGYVIPFSLPREDGREATLWVVSDEGERAWAQMIGN